MSGGSAQLTVSTQYMGKAVVFLVDDPSGISSVRLSLSPSPHLSPLN